MTTFGYFLASEQWGPQQLVDIARDAERSGFEALWISDHFHPWNGEQGQSAFVWSTIGALSQAVSLPVTTAVTCPTVRIHPAVIAHAAATCQVLLKGRFRLGVGTGEALNEHILGDPWPPARIRRDMLEEAVEVMRKLWGGRVVNHDGPHYTVHDARLYTLPDEPPPVYVSGFGPKSARLAGRIGDGFVTMSPDTDAIAEFRAGGGEGKPLAAGVKVCWGPNEGECVEFVRRTWFNEALPGDLAQVLPAPRHFELVSDVVTADAVAASFPCGPDVERHVAAVQAYVDAGFDEIYVSQMGQDTKGFFAFYEKEVLPRVRR